MLLFNFRMATPMSQEDTNFLRLAGLLIRIAPRAVRQRFDFELDPFTLKTFLSKNRRGIEELRGKRVITQAQYDLLYPKGMLTDISKLFMFSEHATK